MIATCLSSLPAFRTEGGNQAALGQKSYEHPLVLPQFRHL